MYYLDESTGNYIPQAIKALDSMPVGTIVDYDGTSANVPVGWEVIENKTHISTATITNGTLTSADLDIRLREDNKALKLYGTISYDATYTISSITIDTGLTNLVDIDTSLKNIAILQDTTDNDLKQVLNGTLNSNGELYILVNPNTNGHSYKVCFMNNEIEI